MIEIRRSTSHRGRWKDHHNREVLPYIYQLRNIGISHTHVSALPSIRVLQLKEKRRWFQHMNWGTAPCLPPNLADTCHMFNVSEMSTGFSLGVTLSPYCRCRIGWAVCMEGIRARAAPSTNSSYVVCMRQSSASNRRTRRGRRTATRTYER
jgi:hypothetical protein